MKTKSKEAMDIGVNGPHCTEISGKKIHHAPDYAKNIDADVIPKGNKGQYQMNIGKWMWANLCFQEAWEMIQWEHSCQDLAKIEQDRM